MQVSDYFVFMRIYVCLYFTKKSSFIFSLKIWCPVHKTIIFFPDIWNIVFWVLTLKAIDIYIYFLKLTFLKKNTNILGGLTPSNFPDGTQSDFHCLFQIHSPFFKFVEKNNK